MSGQSTIIPIGTLSPTISANNRQSQKAAPPDISQSADLTRYNWQAEKTGIARQSYANVSAIALQQRERNEWEKLARERYAAGEFEEAAKYWQQAAVAFEVKGDWLNHAIALSNLSLTYQQFGRWQEADEAIEKSLSLLPPDSGENSPAELRAIAQILDIKGSGQWERGQANNALKTWQQSASIYVKLKDELAWKRSLISQVKAMQGLGLYEQACQALMPVILSEDRGRLAIPDRTCDQLTNPDSLNKLQINLQTQFDSNSKSIQLTGGRLLGDVLRQLGFLDNSEKLLKAVEQVITQENTQEKNPQETALVWLSLGNTYEALGNRNRFLSDSEDIAIKKYYPTALDYYRKAANTAGNSLIKFQAQLNLFSLLVDAKIGNNVNIQEAEELRLIILSQFNQLPPGRQKVYAGVSLMKSLANLKNRELKAANNQPNFRNQKAESLSNYCLSDSPTVLESLSQNTRALSWGDIVNQGAKAVKLGRDLGDLRATAYALGNLGGIYEQKKQWLEAQHCTEQALLLSQNVQQNSPDLAYQWQWQLGRIRRDKEEKDIQGAIAAYTAAFNTLQSIRNDLVPISRDGQFDFRDRVEPVYRELVDLLLQEEKPDQKNLIQARKVIEALQVAELDNFFRDACVVVNKAEEIDAIADRYDPTAAVIHAIILPDRLAIILKLPEQSQLEYRAAAVSEEAVRTTLRELGGYLEQRGKNPEVIRTAKQLYQWVFKPIESSIETNLNVETLVFVLDRPLQKIPMAVLHDGKQHLIEKKYDLVLAPGLQLTNSKKRQNIRFKDIKVFTGGVDEKQPPIENIEFEAIKKWQEEIDGIDKVVTVKKRLLNADFTSAKIRQTISLENYSIIHIKTHGQFSSQPEKTFLVAYRSLLRTKDLDNLVKTGSEGDRRKIELLVLSACQAAKGDDRATLGLAGVAVRAGARSTLSTLWKADDEATAKLMVRFYNELRKPGQKMARALHTAQKGLIEEDGYKNANIWANYVLVGNWLPLISQE